MADETPLVIPIQIDLSRAEQEFGRFEDRVRKGITAPAGGTGVPGGGAPGTPQGQFVPPVTRTAGSQVQALFQNEVNAAWDRNDFAAARRIAAQAQAYGVQVAIPTMGGGMQYGGFGPMEGQQFRRPIGPPALPGVGDVVPNIGYAVGRTQYGPPVAPGFVPPWSQVTGPIPGGYVRGGAMYTAPIGPQPAPGFVPWGQPMGQLGPGGFGPPLPFGFTPPPPPPMPLPRAPIPRLGGSMGFGEAMQERIVGYGPYFQVLFGGMEVGHAYNAAAAASRFATTNPADLQGQLRAWNTSLDQMQRGFAGSLVAMAFQSDRERIESTAGSAARQDEMMRIREASRLYRLGLAGEVRIAGARGTDQARTVAEEKYRVALVESKAAYDTEAEKTRAYLTSRAGELAATRTARGVQEAYRLRNPSGVVLANPGALGYEQTLEGIRRVEAADRATIAAERAQAEGRMASQRAEAEADAKRLRDLALEKANRLDETTTTSALLRSRGQEFPAQLNELIGQEATPTVIASKMNEFFGTVNIRFRRLSRDLDAATRAMNLELGGSPLQAAEVRIENQREQAERGLPPDIFPFNLLPGVNEARQRIRESSEAYKHAARIADFRDRIALQTSNEALAAHLARQPVRAEIIEAIGDWRRATAGITDSETLRAEGNQFGLRVRAIMQRRADQEQLLNINQAGRNAQLDALLDRNPIGANIAGIVSQTRAEEARLRQAGFGAQADEARQLGIKSLRLERQDYLDAFRAVSVSKDFAFSLRNRDAEDPLKLMKSFQSAIGDLGKAGTVPTADPGQLLGELLTEVRNLPEKLRNLITN